MGGSHSDYDLAPPKILTCRVLCFTLKMNERTGEVGVEVGVFSSLKNSKVAVCM